VNDMSAWQQQRVNELRRQFAGLFARRAELEAARKVVGTPLLKTCRPEPPRLARQRPPQAIMVIGLETRRDFAYAAIFSAVSTRQ
jgi:hypothetical protein